MSIMRALLFGLAVWCVLSLPGPAVAQSADEIAEGSDDNGFIINQIEKQLSTDSRRIRLSGVEGALSSRAQVARITISDSEGVWLQIDEATIDWNRSALLRGAIEIERLAAARISIPRQPQSEPSLPNPGARSFSVPDLPVSVRLNDLDVPEINIGEPIFGAETSFAVKGNISIISGSVDSGLEIRRLDGPGGVFSLTAAYEGNSQQVTLDLDVSEPEDGVVANLLNIPGLPSVALSVQANGPITDLMATVDLKTNDIDVVDGQVRILQDPQGLFEFDADLSGRLQDLIDPTLGPFFGASSTLRARGRQRDGGGFALDEFALDTGGLRVSGTLGTLPDGFLERMDITGSLGTGDGNRLILPMPGEETSVAGGELSLTYGVGDRWRGRLAIDDLVSGDRQIEEIRLRMGGVAANISDPEARRLGIRITGAVSGIRSGDASMDQMVGEQIGLRISADWAAGQPFSIAEALIDGPGFDLTLMGDIEDLGFDGQASVSVADLSIYSGLAGRPLAGSVNTTVSGRIDPIALGFDLMFDGAADNIVLNEDALDGIFSGSTRLSGGLARTVEGFRADDFSLLNDQLQLTINGLYAEQGSDLMLFGALSDIGLATDLAQGPITLNVTTGGGQDSLTVDARVTMAEGAIQGKDVSDVTVGLRGSGRSIDTLVGEIDGSGLIGETPLSLQGVVSLADGIQALRGFALTVGQTAAEGTLVRGFDGIIAGSFDLRSPDLGEVAALGGKDAAGAVDLRLTLFRERGTQGVVVTGDIDGLDVADARLDQAAVDLRVTDLLGTPLVDGRLDARGAGYGDRTLENLSLSSVLDGQTMGLAADAVLDTGLRLVTLTDLTRITGGYGLALEQLVVTSDIADARLLEPADVTILGSKVTTTPLRLGIDDGVLTIAGVIDETLDLSVVLEDLDLAIANAVVPELEVAGLLDGRATITGPQTAPEVVFDLTGSGLSAAATAAAGLPPVDFSAQGQTEGQLVTLTASILGGDVVDISGSGQVPFDPMADPMDLTMVVNRLEVSLLDPLVGDLGLAGQVTGTAAIAGMLPLPDVVFDVTAADIVAPVMLGDQMPPLNLTATGQTEADAVTLDAVITGGDAIDMTVAGRVPFDPLSDPIDARVDLNRLDVSVFDALAGDLGLGGTVTGSAIIEGALPAPVLSFDVVASQIVAPAVLGPGVPPLDLTATGQTEADVLNLEAALTGGTAVDVTVAGAIPLNPEAEGLAVDVALNQLQLAILDSFAVDQGIRGLVTGTAALSGSLSAPSATFDADATGLATDLTAANGVTGVRLSVSGGFADDVVTLTSVTAQGPRSLSFSASGAIPIRGPGLNVSVQGQVPLILANVALARAQVQMDGQADLAATVSGTLNQPAFNGRVSVAGGRIVVPRRNLFLENVNLEAQLTGNQLNLAALSADLNAGGSVDVGGSITLDQPAGYPADLRITLTDARYADGEVLSTRGNGALTLTGPLTDSALLAGTLTLDRTELVIPSNFGINEGVLLDVRHLEPPQNVTLTLDRAGLGGDASVEGRPFNLRLDLTIDAPNRLFIRGRGLDAEMGGSITVRGSTLDLIPVGQIELIRGRLGILGQRFEFDEGSVALSGTLDPTILLVAETTVSDGTLIFITVSGSATDPEISFTSSPALPQDEVLALLIFNQNVSDLSPIQIAQLASAAATLAGRGGGIVDDFRSGAGLANLDITTDEDGNIGVRAGAYLDENTYLDVETDSLGDSKVTINLDITENVRARASVDSDGEGRIGIFFERDY